MHYNIQIHVQKVEHVTARDAIGKNVNERQITDVLDVRLTALSMNHLVAKAMHVLNGEVDDVERH